MGTKQLLGKKLYKSGALLEFKLLYIGIAMVLLGNLVLQTLVAQSFVQNYEQTLGDVVAFHLKFPQDFLIYCLTILFPAIYYAFIRGIVFYENALLLNRGLPFFNRHVLYTDIDYYKIIHPKYLMGVKRKDIGEEFVFTVRDIDRVVAIFDQRNIKGDLGQEQFKKTLTVNKKLFVIFIFFSIVVFIVQYFGGFSQLLK